MSVLLIGLQTGLALASIYLLVAMSLTLILAVSSVFNFVQATLLMLATIFTFELSVKFGWPVLLVLVVLLMFGILAGVLTHTLLIRPAIHRTKELLETTLLTTLGAYTAINAAAALAFGSDTLPIPGYVSSTPIRIGNFPLNRTYLLIIAGTIFLTLCFYQLLRRSELGRITRVTLEDTDAARLLGIDTGKVVLISFAAAGALVMFAGWLVAPVLGASAFTAQDLAFFAFVVMAIGGFGSFQGAAIGALLVGVVSGVVPVYIDSVWTTPILLLLTTLVLVIRPRGILGTAGLFGSMGSREI